MTKHLPLTAISHTSYRRCHNIVVSLLYIRPGAVCLIHSMTSPCEVDDGSLHVVAKLVTLHAAGPARTFCQQRCPWNSWIRGITYIMEREAKETTSMKSQLGKMLKNHRM